MIGISPTMPRIFGNLESDLLSALRQTLTGSHRADCRVGYFNLRAWEALNRVTALYAPRHH